MNFIILPKPEPQPTDFFDIRFYAHSCNPNNRHEAFIGSYVGALYQDDDFMQMIERVKGKIQLSGVNFFISVSRMGMKEYRRLTAEQKYQRRASKLFNQFTDRINDIRKSSSLFKVEEEAKLQHEYLEAVEKNKAIYQEQLKG